MENRWVAVKIINKKNGDLISKNCILADDIFSRAHGLMFSKDNKKTIFFVFEKEGKNPIHSIFVNYPFYAIYLDKNKKVNEIIKVRPYSFYIENKRPAKYLLESFNLKLKIKIGDVIECLDGK